MSSDLGVLVCGDLRTVDVGEDSELAKIFTHLQTMIDRILGELGWLGTQLPERIAMYGPFLGRSLLELGLTALIGRIDPTRLLVVKRTQEHGDYSANKPWNSAIRWQGDVLAKKVTDLWSPDTAYKDMTKALFGDYYVELFWIPCMKKLADLEVDGGAWLAELKAMTAPGFCRQRRELVGQLYSFASKGIHSEFVVPPGSLYDHATITNQITKIAQTLAELGLLINMIPHALYKLGPDEAFASFNRVEQDEIIA